MPVLTGRPQNLRCAPPCVLIAPPQVCLVGPLCDGMNGAQLRGPGKKCRAGISWRALQSTWLSVRCSRLCAGSISALRREKPDLPTQSCKLESPHRPQAPAPFFPGASADCAAASAASGRACRPALPPATRRCRRSAATDPLASNAAGPWPATGCRACRTGWAVEPPTGSPQRWAAAC